MSDQMISLAFECKSILMQLLTPCTDNMLHNDSAIINMLIPFLTLEFCLSKSTGKYWIFLLIALTLNHPKESITFINLNCLNLDPEIVKITWH